MATKDVPPGKPRRYLWPAEAVNIAQKKQHPVRLCEELTALTGYDKAACWRFLKKHGVERPGTGSRRTFIVRIALTGDITCASCRGPWHV